MTHHDPTPTLPAPLEAIGEALPTFGGHLRCETCGTEQPLGDTTAHIRHGWPRCCGHTMRWWTQRQLDAGDMPEHPRAAE